MSAPAKSWDSLRKSLRATLSALPDRRTGANTSYTMEDIAGSAFEVFFTQSPSFLAHQTTQHTTKRQSNARNLFPLKNTPSANHIRDTLDPVAPEHLFPLYDEVFEELRHAGQLAPFRAVQDTLLMALDGTWYYSSHKLHCPQCSCLEHANGEKTYYHSAITPVLVAPGQPEAIALRPEFITPQDGHTKQDCEIAAAKRWLEQHGATYAPLQVTLLGDDLYAHQPMCRRALLYDFHFIFVCKPESHKTLYDWVNLLVPGQGLHTLTLRLKNGAHWETYTYRYANHVPLADGDDALRVNWCELTLTDAAHQVLYRNSFITDFRITDHNVAAVVAAGRSRWKIENENNNTLKTKGYHLEHNFGHGQQHLSALLATFNLLAFLYHTYFALTQENYRSVRAALPTRETFFDDLRALLRYCLFSSWDALLDFMMQGLEIGPYAPKA